jgi:membrane-associated phospholipid phosphatase
MSSATTTTPPNSGINRVRQSLASTRLVWITIAVLVVAFAALAFAAHAVPYFPVDLTITQAIQGVPAPWFHALMVAVSWPGFPPQVYIAVVLVAILFYALHRRRAAVYLVASSVSIDIVIQGVKLLVDRPRPSPALVHVLIPGLNGGHWSFPSGHTESFVVAFGFILYVAYTEWRPNIARTAAIICGLLMIALIGVSRIDSGEHWFSDVVGGYMLGTIFLLALLYWFRRRKPEAERIQP